MKVIVIKKNQSIIIQIIHGDKSIILLYYLIITVIGKWNARSINKLYSFLLFK